MRRSEIWTVPGGPGYAGKPRPAVIIEDDRFDTNSVTMCPFATDPIDAPLFRLSIDPRESKGLTAESRLMIDKITTVRRTKLGISSACWRTLTSSNSTEPSSCF